MILLHWIAFGIGSQLLFIPLAVLVGGLAFWSHSRTAEKKSVTAFLLPAFLTLAVGVWRIGTGLITLGYLNVGSADQPGLADQILASLREHQAAIDASSVRFALLPALLFAGATLLFLGFKRAVLRWSFAAVLFIAICGYLGFLDSHFIPRHRGKARIRVPVAPPKALARFTDRAVSVSLKLEGKEKPIALFVPSEFKVPSTSIEVALRDRQLNALNSNPGRRTRYCDWMVYDWNTPEKMPWLMVASIGGLIKHQGKLSETEWKRCKSEMVSLQDKNLEASIAAVENNIRAGAKVNLR